MAIGANGWGPFEERGYVTKLGTFDADVAIIDLPLDDLARPLYGLMDDALLRRPPTRPPWPSKSFSTTSPGATARRTRASAESGSRSSVPLGVAEYWAPRRRSLRPRRARGLRRDPPGQLVRHGRLPRNDSSMEWLEPMEATFKAHHVVSSYPAGSFAGKGTQKDIYYDEMHLNPKGHKMYAEFLVGQLRGGVALRSWLTGAAAPPGHPGGAPGHGDVQPAVEKP